MQHSRRLIATITLGILALLALGTGAITARNTDGPTQPTIEVVVFEAPACRYCALFRETLAPRYQNSTSHAQAPMRFVDATLEDKDPDGLAAPITVLPTIVILHNGVEKERLEGYPAPEALFLMVRSWLQRI